MKKNFAIDDKVVLRGFGSNSDLEGATGVILGKSFDHAETDFYIVLLDNPLPDFKAVCMIESCIYPQVQSTHVGLDAEMQSMIKKLTAEQYRVKVFLNENNFNCTAAPFVICKRYRDELKQQIRVLYDNLHN